MIALFAALEMETAPLLHRMTSASHESMAGFETHTGIVGGQQTVICRTGMGSRAAAAAGMVIEKHGPSAVISYGIGGALSADLRPGDIVACKLTILLLNGMNAIESDPKLVESALSAPRDGRTAVVPGSALTVERVIASADEKRDLRTRTGHDIVEMEGYWVGQVARTSGLPFLAVRAASDRAADRVRLVPGIFDDAGRLYRAKVIPYILRRPWCLPDLARLSRNQGRAVTSLGRFLPGLVASLAAALPAPSAEEAA